MTTGGLQEMENTMDLGASAAALNVLTWLLLPLVLFSTISSHQVTRAVRGSHQRWLWAGLHRLGLVVNMIFNAAQTVYFGIKGPQWLTALFALLFLSACLSWHFWHKHNDDDDFWNSLSKKAKKLGARLRSALSGASSAAPQHG